ncbi:hypothetical protein VNO80_22963 [Phaseolus coccineus]|uniref:Uncharacterized protein n=1 Tax=Phaseolus coccineus TaxID=3886 RepID=A0AAN9QUK0_PHACN
MIIENHCKEAFRIPSSAVHMDIQGMLKLTLSSLVASFFVVNELPHTRRPSAASEEKCKRRNDKTTLVAAFSAKTKVVMAVTIVTQKRRGAVIGCKSLP